MRQTDTSALRLVVCLQLFGFRSYEPPDLQRKHCSGASMCLRAAELRSNINNDYYNDND